MKSAPRFQRFADALLAEPEQRRCPAARTGRHARSLHGPARHRPLQTGAHAARSSLTSPTRTSPWKATCTASSAISRQWMQDNKFDHLHPAIPERQDGARLLPARGPKQRDPDRADAALHPIPAAGPAGPATHLPAGRLLGLQDPRQQGSCRRTIRPPIHFSACAVRPSPRAVEAQDKAQRINLIAERLSSSRALPGIFADCQA